MSPRPGGRCPKAVAGLFTTLILGVALLGSSPTADAASSSLKSMITRIARSEGVDPDLVHAVVRAESGYNVRERSGVGAVGLMQLMPATARGLGVKNPWDPAQNVRGGTRFLGYLIRRYNGNLRLAIAAYNAGPGAVDRYGGVPPYRETQHYVVRVLAYLRSLKRS